MPEVITRPEDITAEWLSGVIQRHDPGVRSSSVAIVLVKELPYSTTIRFTVDYRDHQTQLPIQFFLKLCKNDVPDIGGVSIAKQEVEFYRSVAPNIPVPPLIKCFDTAVSHQSDRSHILLEDLSHSHCQPLQNTAPNEQDSRRAVRALAAFHAVFWDSPELGKKVGRIFDRKDADSLIHTLRRNYRSFVSEGPSVLTSKQLDTYKRVLASAELVWSRVGQVPGLTVTHGDTHWWNFLYPKDPTVDDVRLFDWHLWHVDRGARDLAFLIALGGFAELRPSLEVPLLKEYLDSLRSHGVMAYSWDELWEDYRWAAIRNLNIPIIFWAQGKHDSTVTTALERAFSSFDLLRCDELIG